MYNIQQQIQNFPSIWLLQLKITIGHGIVIHVRYYYSRVNSERIYNFSGSFELLPINSSYYLLFIDSIASDDASGILHLHSVLIHLSIIQISKYIVSIVATLHPVICQFCILYYYVLNKCVLPTRVSDCLL